MVLTILELVSRDWGEGHSLKGLELFSFGVRDQLSHSFFYVKLFLGFLGFPNFGRQRLASSGMGDAL